MVSVICDWFFCHRRFGVPSRTISFEDAVAIDRGSSIVAFFSDDYYLDPVLKSNFGEEVDRAPLSVSFVSSNLDEISMDSFCPAETSRASGEPEADAGPRANLLASVPR